MSTVHDDWIPPGDSDAPPPEDTPPDIGEYRRRRDPARAPGGVQELPSDAAAERAALGAMLLSARAINDVSERVQAGDFYQPSHEVIYDAIVYLYARAVAVDAVTVSDELARRGSLVRCGGSAYLHELIEAVPTVASAAHYAGIVAERAALRRIVEAGARISQLGYGGGDTSVVDVYARARAEIERIEDSTAIAGVPGIDRPQDGTPVDVFLAADTDDEPLWLVPGFLERRDRIIVTASEGAGKSTLLRQWAVQIAAGVHPFTLREVPPQRVILLDLENSERQVRRKLRPLVHQVQRIIDPSRLIIACKGDGLDLSDAGDRSWLDRLIATHQADIVLGGPLYKMTGGNPNDEVDVKPAALYLDTLRARHDVSLVLEAHSRKGENAQSKNRPKEPFGWSGWMRWPEFGIHLDKDGKITHWRGERETDREIPESLHRGGTWPWMPVFENSRLAMYLRVEACVQSAGRMLSQREIAQQTGLSQPLVSRVIGEHQSRWSRLAGEIGGESGE